MKIEHIHLESCSSTQDFLKDLIDKKHPSHEVLVSTENQTAGYGRKNGKWLHFEKALAFSMSLTPQKHMTHTPLEVAVLIALFMEKKFRKRVQLKWPNDLLDDHNIKCGGIICQTLGSRVVAGIGLNLSVSDHDPRTTDFPHSHLSLDFSSDNNFKALLPFEIAEFIHHNRLSGESVLEKWQEFCAHLDQEVSVVSENEVIQGLFKGLGTFGEAIIMDIRGVEHRCFNGTLRFS